MTSITPIRTPRVANKPVPLNGIVANIDDSMVSFISRTSVILENSTLIVSEIVVNVEMSGVRSVIIDGLGKCFCALEGDVDCVITRDGGRDGRVVQFASS